MSNQLEPVEQKVATLAQLLESPKVQRQLAAALPRHIPAEKFSRFVLTQVRKIPKLTECTMPSLFGAVIEAAQLGLEVGVRGECWILPFYNKKSGKTEATLIPGYLGMLALAYRSGKLSSVSAHVVYEGDDFDFQFGRNPDIRHKPTNMTTIITHAYATLETTMGGYMLDVMTVDEINKVRDRSRSKDSGPWTTDYPAMCCKTVLKRLLKLAPVSSELSRAIELDDAAEIGTPQGIDAVIDLEPEATE